MVQSRHIQCNYHWTRHWTAEVIPALEGIQPLGHSLIALKLGSKEDGKMNSFIIGMESKEYLFKEKR